MAKEAMTAKYWLQLGDDGILRVKIREECFVNIEDIRLFYEAYERLTGEVPVPWLVDATKSYSITREAQEYGAAQSHRRLGMAVITHSTITRIMLNAYTTMFRPKSPLRVFTDEADAIEWLKQFLK